MMDEREPEMDENEPEPELVAVSEGAVILGGESVTETLRPVCRKRTPTGPCTRWLDHEGECSHEWGENLKLPV